MKVCLVVGDVVSSQKSEMIEGFKLLVVQPVDMYDLKPQGSPYVAVDTVGAGEGEVVLVVAGSSSRLTKLTNKKPVDAAIMGIIDYITIKGEKTFSK